MSNEKRPMPKVITQYALKMAKIKYTAFGDGTLIYVKPEDLFPTKFTIPAEQFEQLMRSEPIPAVTITDAADRENEQDEVGEFYVYNRNTNDWRIATFEAIKLALLMLMKGGGVELDPAEQVANAVRATETR